MDRRVLVRPPAHKNRYVRMYVRVRCPWQAHTPARTPTPDGRPRQLITHRRHEHPPAPSFHGIVCSVAMSSCRLSLSGVKSLLPVQASIAPPSRAAGGAWRHAAFADSLPKENGKEKKSNARNGNVSTSVAAGNDRSHEVEKDQCGRCAAHVSGLPAHHFGDFSQIRHSLGCTLGAQIPGEAPSEDRREASASVRSFSALGCPTSVVKSYHTV